MRITRIESLPNHTISEDGTVVDLHTHRKIIPFLDKQTGCYCFDTRGKRYYIHRLVAEAFVPNTEGYRFVVHIDGNKQNNQATNLAWRQLSNQRAANNLRQGSAKIALVALDNQGEIVHVCIGYDEVEAKGFKRTGVSQALRNNCRHRGYYWRKAYAHELIERELYQPGLRVHS